MKLNGWRRLAIVIISFYVIASISLLTYEIIKNQDGFFVELTLPVGTIIEGDKAKLPDGRIVQLNTKIDGKEIKPWEIKWDNEPEIPTELVVKWGNLFSIIFLPFLIWGLLEIFVKIFHWVVNGFREQKSV